MGEDSGLSSMALDLPVRFTSISHYFPRATVLPPLLGYFSNEEPSEGKNIIDKTIWLHLGPWKKKEN